MRLLVTRPVPDDACTAATLRSHGHHVLSAPMLCMEKLDCTFPEGPYSALLMTSANAARAVAGGPLCAKLSGLPVYTVGRHTAEAARSAGFREVHCADGDRGDLALMLRGEPSSRLFLHLAGEDRAGDFHFPPAAGRVVVAVVYRMAKAGCFPADVEMALREGQIEGVLHYSRRSAQAYVECAARVGLLPGALDRRHFCLSGQVAEPLVAQQLGRQAVGGVKIAAHPDEAALIALVDSCAKDSCADNSSAKGSSGAMRSAKR
jgi:uroporphyrinogen-III synthase